MRTCTLSTQLQAVIAVAQPFWVPASPKHFRTGISSALLDPSTTVSSVQEHRLLLLLFLWTGWVGTLENFFCLCSLWKNMFMTYGLCFLFEINSNIADCPFLDSSIKDVVHLHLCLLVKLPAWKHPCGCVCFLWKSHHMNAKYHPIWFIYTFFFFWLCIAWVQWQPS